MNGAAVDTIGRINRAAVVNTIGHRIAQAHGQRIARQVFQNSGIVASLRRLTDPEIRRLERAMRRRNWVAALEFLGVAGLDLQRLMAWLAVRQQEDLAEIRTEARAQRRRRPPRYELHPVRTRRCSRAPNDVSSLPLCPEVAA
jgi:hypothetical protein